MTAERAPATLYQRYVARCQGDAAALLAQVCREAGAAPAGAGLWVAPAQRQARQTLPALARDWAAHLWRPATTPAPQHALPQSRVAHDFGVPSGLALMSDDDVDEDIESTRLVQAIEAAGEWSLRELRSRLASVPPAGGNGRDDHVPLAPAKVVHALCAALHDHPLEPAVRLAALRTVAEPLARALGTLYQQHADLLASWGLQPARYTIRREPEARGAGADPAGTAPSPAGGAVGVAAGRIPALLAQVAGEAGLGTGMQALMSRLAGPAARSVAADPRLLDSMDNALWRLIDRLAALGQLDAEPAPGASSLRLPLHLRLEPIIASLEAAGSPVTAERYARALAEAEAEAGIAADTTRPAPAGPTAPAPLASAPVGAPPGGPFSEPALAAAERRQALEPLARQQMVARLRDSAVLPEVKQFLLGPWQGAVVHALVVHGEETPEAQRVLRAVESLIDAGGPLRRGPLSRAELDCLRMDAEEGLAAAGLPAPRIRRHVDDLMAALAAWPRPLPDTGAPAEAAGADEQAEMPADMLAEWPDWPRHEELATVPIALDAHNPDERALRDCEAWLDGLAVGDVCRIQRQGQWDTLRLNWRSDNAAYFAFGNASGLAFCASRRVLGRMRLEGLATTMARGQWVQRAVDTLPMQL